MRVDDHVILALMYTFSKPEMQPLSGEQIDGFFENVFNALQQRKERKMLDASSHDVNCSYANDPNAECDCGGKKRAEYQPVDFGNDNSALAGIAGAMPSLMDGATTTLQQQIALNKEAAIQQAARKAFGDGWEKDRANFTVAITPDKHEIYKKADVPFLELWPVTFETRHNSDLTHGRETFVTKAEQHYRFIPVQP